MTTKKPAEQLRSARWFAPDDFRSFGHRSRFMQMGFGPDVWKVAEKVLEGRSILGLYPPTDEASRTEFAAWRRALGR